MDGQSVLVVTVGVRGNKDTSWDTDVWNWIGGCNDEHFGRITVEEAGIVNYFTNNAFEFFAHSRV